MRATRCFSAVFIAATLAFALPLAALAEPATPAESTTAREQAPEPTPSSAPATDEEKYADREARDGSAEDFKGGDALIITSGAVVVVLLVVLLIVLL